MKRIFVIVEGKTEESFVNGILRQYFFTLEIFNLIGILIQTSNGHKGGFVNYQHLKNDILKRLREPDVVVSTFIDFFRIPTSIPDYAKMLRAVDPNTKIDILEKGMASDIDHPRFLPYIQKFEFEALLFSNNQGFSAMYNDIDSGVAQATQSIIDQYPDPEDINNHPDTAPSKRIQKILSDYEEKYDKVVEGNLMAEEIGIHTILEKCPRFRAWVEKLIAACQ